MIEMIEMTYHGLPWQYHGGTTSEAAAIAAARALLELVPFKDPSEELSGGFRGVVPFS